MSPWYYLLVLVEAPIFLWFAYLGGWPFFLLIGAAMLMGLSELYSALIVKGMRPDVGVGCVIGVLMLAAAAFAPANSWPELLIGLVFLAVAGSLGTQFTRTGEPCLIRDAAVTLLGVLYVAVPMSFLVALRNIDVALLATGESAGPVKARLGAIVIVAACVWLSDTAAWMFGHMFGRVKLAPRLSPGKTVEGALAGGIAAVVTAVLAGLWAGLPVQHGIALGLIIGLSAQLGDLAESVIKRDLRIKDFGTIVGPHGGMLDTFDGLLFAAPVTWIYLWAWFLS